MMQKGKIKNVLTLILFLAIFLTDAAPAPAADFQKMLDARTAVCWVEGEGLDELVLNARGRLAFICVDRKLGESIRDTRNKLDPWDRNDPPEWLRVFGKNYAGRRGETLFVVGIRASKPWTFDTGLLTVAGRAVEAGDIVRGIISDPAKEIPPGESELPTDYEGIMSFFVPSSILKAGTEIEIGYGGDAVKWKVPGRNE